ncbi:MAG: DEAD/DEAH box helicase [Acidimicrobiales bacterium]
MWRAPTRPQSGRCDSLERFPPAGAAATRASGSWAGGDRRRGGARPGRGRVRRGRRGPSRPAGHGRSRRPGHRRERRHLVVQAGTGTGKSLAYLVPAICSGQRVVVATATKALQDQLVGKDLPFLEQHLGEPFTFACMKGRSNYACVQRAREAASANQEQLALDGLDEPSVGVELRRLVRWVTRQLDADGPGDRAGLPFEPSPKGWGAVSVTSRECPGDPLPGR